jgi:hypothetical protein
MADHRFVVVDTTHAQDVSPFCAPTDSAQPTAPLDASDVYKSLPNGCWIVPLHGSCSRCHHYHKAVQVRIKVAQDQIQASHIHCDNCKDPWVAFSARNATQVSLLSTITTEPDLIASEIRTRLIDIINRATVGAANGTLTNPSSPVLLLQPSGVARVNDNLGCHSDSITHTTSSKRHETDVVTEPARQHQHSKPTMTKPRRSSTSNKQRSNFSRILSKVKTKITARIPMLYRGRYPETPEPLTISTRQLDKSPVRTPPAAKAEAITINMPLAEPQLHGVTGDQGTPELYSTGVTATEPDKLSEVATFLASLDRSALDSMTDDERKKWMRKAYTDFKSRNKRSKVSIGLSPIIETSIAGELPRAVGHINRRSDEVRYAGSHIEDLELVPRRFSTSSSNAAFDAQSFSDDNTVVNTVVTAPGNSAQSRLQQLRRGTDVQRPQSMPNAPPSPRLFHRRGRGSFDSRMYRGGGSTSSLRGHPASLRSQGSMTLNGSTVSLYQTLSEAIIRPSESVERLDLDNMDLLPPAPIGLRDHSESPPPSRSAPPENSESGR